jgi:hypothetical protein
MEEFGGIRPSSVEIYTKDVAAVVSLDHTIGVEHRYYLKNKELSQSLSFS